MRYMISTLYIDIYITSFNLVVHLHSNVIILASLLHPKMLKQWYGPVYRRKKTHLTVYHNQFPCCFLIAVQGKEEETTRKPSLWLFYTNISPLWLKQPICISTVIFSTSSGVHEGTYAVSIKLIGE